MILKDWMFIKICLNSDGELWRMARIKDQEELQSLLDEFGVIVIPDEYGNFAHNSAFYLVDKQGTLLEVMDYKKIDEASEYSHQISLKKKQVRS